MAGYFTDRGGLIATLQGRTPEQQRQILLQQQLESDAALQNQRQGILSKASETQRIADVQRQTAGGTQQARNALMGMGMAPGGGAVMGTGPDGQPIQTGRYDTMMQSLGQNIYQQVQGGIDPQSAAQSALGASQQGQMAYQNQLAQQMVEAQYQAQQRQLAEQNAFNAAARPLFTQGNDIANVRDMKNLLAEEGKLVLPGQAKGTYSVLRGQLLNSIRRQFEAGALQQAELEFFQTLLPDATTWTSLSQNERMAMLNELEYQMLQQLTIAAGTSGYDFQVNQLIRPTRSVDELLTGGVPQGFEDITPDAPVAVGPSGDLSPFSGFFQMLGK